MASGLVPKTRRMRLKSKSPLDGPDAVVKAALFKAKPSPRDRTRALRRVAFLNDACQGSAGLTTSSHFGFLGCGGVGWLGWGRLRRCSAGRARWRPSEGQGFQELGPGGEHNIGAQGLQVVEEAGSGSKRLAGVPPSA